MLQGFSWVWNDEQLENFIDLQHTNIRENHLQNTSIFF